MDTDKGPSTPVRTEDADSQVHTASRGLELRAVATARPAGEAWSDSVVVMAVVGILALDGHCGRFAHLWSTSFDTSMHSGDVRSGRMIGNCDLGGCKRRLF